MLLDDVGTLLKFGRTCPTFTPFWGVTDDMCCHIKVIAGKKNYIPCVFF